MTLAWLRLSCHQTDNPCLFVVGAIHTTSFSRLLAEFGFNPIVLFDHWSPSMLPESSLTFRSGAHAHTDENVALLGTLIAIFTITEFYGLKMNDWQFDPFETGLAFVVALIIRNFVQVAAKKDVRELRFGALVFLLIAAPLILLDYARHALHSGTDLRACRGVCDMSRTYVLALTLLSPNPRSLSTPKQT